MFVHSYEPSLDPDGSTLRGILTAPLVVGQWINAQYYFSTTDPEVFGAGSKTVHNVLGDVGVLTGPGGDLRRGLPLQSVRAGDRLLHEPVRMMTVVAGSLDHIDAAIEGSPVLRRLGPVRRCPPVDAARHDDRRGEHLAAPADFFAQRSERPCPPAAS